MHSHYYRRFCWRRKNDGDLSVLLAHTSGKVIRYDDMQVPIQ
jgi:hypothetical protein